MKVDFFEEIKISLPKNKVYNRLGYVAGRTVIAAQRAEMVDKCVDEALDIIDLKGAGARWVVEETAAGKVKFEGGILFKSESLAAFISGCEEAVAMGATAGALVVERIRGDSRGGKDVSKAVIYDAVASEMVDAALDWIMSYYNRQLVREGKTLTSARFSAGYGDFGLENQRVFHDKLKMARIGVALSGGCVLEPEKSVTALAGVK